MAYFFKNCRWGKYARISLLIFLIQKFGYYREIPNLQFYDNTDLRKYQLYYPYYTIFDPKEDTDREFMVEHEF